MAIGLVGRKAGMTRVFTDAGETVPVTVIEVLPNRVTQVKAQDKDGYRAVQVTYGTRRPPGSIGQRQTPGRVFKGRRMSGHMGVVRRTTENLRVVQVDVARNLLLIRGAVPGAEGGQVIVRPSLKAARRATRKTVTPTKTGAAPSKDPAKAGKK